jgi:hypothetical protein
MVEFATDWEKAKERDIFVKDPIIIWWYVS